jgi:hypothetical protein
MADFYIPKDEEITITVHSESGSSVDIDISSVQEMLIKSYDQAEQTDTGWHDHFVVLFQAEYGIRLKRTAAVLLVKKVQEMTEQLKKSCFESLSSTTDTTSPSPND